MVDYEHELLEVLDSEEVRDEHKSRIMGLLFRLRDYHLPTFEHSVRVGLTSRKIAQFIHQDPKRGLYGVLHDIGKLSVPLEVLNRTESFTEEDMQAMRTHVTEGYRMLIEKEFFFASWLALTHHRFQAHGYPTDLEMASFPFPIKDACKDTRLIADEMARVVSLADTYDATKNRCNSRFGGRTPTPTEVKQQMIKDNRGRKKLVEDLYGAEIFSLEPATILH